MLILVRRSFSRVVWPCAALGTILIALQFVIVAVAASFESSRSFERLAAIVPGFVTRSFASSLLTLASFRAMAVAGYFHPVVVLIVTQFAIFLASEPAGEIESGLVDLVLARPIPRRWLVTRSVLVVATATIALAGAMAAATAIGLILLAPPGASRPSAWTVLVLSAELLMLAWCFGAAALAAAAFARRRATAITLVGLVAVGLYLLEFIGASWEPAAPFGRISPFHYYAGTSILVGRADVSRDLTVLGSLAAAGVAIAYWQIARRDL